MNLTITKEEYQEIEMFLNIIVDQAQHLSSGNVAHKASSIILHSNAIRNKLNKPRYKCFTCKDTGKLENPMFDVKAGKAIPHPIPCPLCSNQ